MAPNDMSVSIPRRRLRLAEWWLQQMTAAAPPFWWRLPAWILSQVFALLLRCRAGYYALGFGSKLRLPGKVIAIGNISVGGTGKSPVTIRLAECLIARGQRPVILTRGYGGNLGAKDSLALLAGSAVMPSLFGTSAAQKGRWPDEARMQSEALPTVPVIIGRDRHRAARRFLLWREKHKTVLPWTPTHWLLDDGFQHRRLSRDFDLVLLDAKTPLSTAQLLPRGILREPVSALKRAQLLVFTRIDATSPTALDLKLATDAAPSLAAPPLLASLASTAPGTAVDGRTGFDRRQHAPAALVSAIANGDQLQQGVEALGIAVSTTLRAIDHAALSRLELLERLGSAQSVLTTAKDYWRDPEVFSGLPVPVFIVPLRLDWDDETVLSALRVHGAL